MELDWSSYLAPRTAGMQSSAIREILKLTQQPGVISFAGGLPASEFFPLEEIEQACMRSFGRKEIARCNTPLPRGIRR
jgi:2-aminoadipate transaminase